MNHPPHAYFVCTGVLLTDGHHRTLGDSFWENLLPEVQLVDSGPRGGEAVLNSIDNPVWVSKLIVGTRGACLHWGHCVHPEIKGEDGFSSLSHKASCALHL